VKRVGAVSHPLGPSAITSPSGEVKGQQTVPTPGRFGARRSEGSAPARTPDHFAYSRRVMAFGASRKRRPPRGTRQCVPCTAPERWVSTVADALAGPGDEPATAARTATVETFTMKVSGKTCIMHVMPICGVAGRPLNRVSNGHGPSV
jgi:hypothetical protein